MCCISCFIITRDVYCDAISAGILGEEGDAVDKVLRRGVREGRGDGDGRLKEEGVEESKDEVLVGV
jgi:Arc/MetJ family transcription regulator